MSAISFTTYVLPAEGTITEPGDISLTRFGPLNNQTQEIVVRPVANGVLGFDSTGALGVLSSLSLGGTLSVTGNTTFNKPIIAGNSQALSGAGAVNVTTLVTKLTTTGSAQALTLADGTDGQIKIIAHVVDGGSGVLTPTTKTGYSTVTFTNAGDTVILQFFTTVGWLIIGSRGVTIA